MKSRSNDEKGQERTAAQVPVLGAVLPVGAILARARDPHLVLCNDSSLVLTALIHLVWVVLFFIPIRHILLPHWQRIRVPFVLGIFGQRNLVFSPIDPQVGIRLVHFCAFLVDGDHISLAHHGTHEVRILVTADEASFQDLNPCDQRAVYRKEELVADRIHTLSDHRSNRHGAGVIVPPEIQDGAVEVGLAQLVLRHAETPCLLVTRRFGL
mmetsp:Transcript_49900/g.79672  ORF Transcript_49900/g.79672 Transcript_49900/m.79672 type:complete len:211 (-) Transcript_49900:387-1019(-)